MSTSRAMRSMLAGFAACTSTLVEQLSKVFTAPSLLSWRSHFALQPQLTSERAQPFLGSSAYQLAAQQRSAQRNRPRHCAAQELSDIATPNAPIQVLRGQHLLQHRPWLRRCSLKQIHLNAATRVGLTTTNNALTSALTFLLSPCTYCFASVARRVAYAAA